MKGPFSETDSMGEDADCAQGCRALCRLEEGVTIVEMSPADLAGHRAGDQNPAARSRAEEGGPQGEGGNCQLMDGFKKVEFDPS